MKKDLYNLNSWRAKPYFYVFGIILFYMLYWLTTQVSNWKTIVNNQEYFSPIMAIILIIISIKILTDFHLGYVDLKNNLLILKKPIIKKVWKIKLEDILIVESYRVGYTINKNLKITVRTSPADTKNYYIFKSSSFISDDADFLWKAALKRKKEIHGSK